MCLFFFEPHLKDKNVSDGVLVPRLWSPSRTASELNSKTRTMSVGSTQPAGRTSLTSPNEYAPQWAGKVADGEVTFPAAAAAATAAAAAAASGGYARFGGVTGVAPVGEYTAMRAESLEIEDRGEGYADGYITTVPPIPGAVRSPASPVRAIRASGGGFYSPLNTANLENGGLDPETKSHSFPKKQTSNV